MNTYFRTSIVAAAFFVCGWANAQPPQVKSALIAPFPAPYDEGANAHAEVAAAIARAAAEHKFVLLDFGGNWCPDCRATSAALSLPEVKPWVDRHFEMVKIDIGRLNKNMDIAARYKANIKAVPTIIILDQQGRMINAGNPAALKDARGMSAQAIVDAIDDWIEKPS